MLSFRFSIVAGKRGNKTGTMIVALLDGEAEAEGHCTSKYNFKAHF